MANDKVYNDYLMHGRTKGSKNGISTTKGYTAIGQKAKGRWVNGRYVYDTIPLPRGNAADGRFDAISRRYSEHRKEPTAKIPNWQNEANKTAAMRTMLNKWETGEIDEGLLDMPNQTVRSDAAVNPRIRNKKISERKAKEYAKSRTSVISPNKGKKMTYNTPKSYGGNVENMQSGRVTKPLSPYVSDEYLREIEYNSRKNDGSVENHPDAISVNAHHRAYLQGEAEKQGRNAAYEYAKKQAFVNLKNKAKKKKKYLKDLFK